MPNDFDRRRNQSPCRCRNNRNRRDDRRDDWRDDRRDDRRNDRRDDRRNNNFWRW